MPPFFQNLFDRRTIAVNIQNQVSQPVKFKKRTFQQLQALYSDLVDVRIIEDYISDAVAKVPVTVTNAAGDEIEEGTELHNLIKQSNPEQSWQELIKEALILYGTTGNMYLYWYENYIYSLATSTVLVNTGMNKDVPEFMNYVSSYTLDFSTYQFQLEYQDVFHLKTAQLQSYYGEWAYGSSPYDAMIPNLTSLESNYSSRVSIIRDRAALAFLTNESEIPDQEQTQIVQKALNDYGLTEGKSKILATTQKLRYNQMLLGLQELELIANLDVDFSRLCNARGIDPVVFSKRDSTYNNQEAADKGSLRKAIIPLTMHFYDKFNEWIRPRFGGLRIEPQVDNIAELSDLGLEQSQKVISEVNAGIITAEQAQEILYGADMSFEVQEENIQQDGN